MAPAQRIIIDREPSAWARIFVAVLIFVGIFALGRWLAYQDAFEAAATVITVMLMHLGANWIPRTKPAASAASGISRVVAAAQEESAFIAMWTGQGSRLGECFKGLIKGVAVVAGKNILVAGSAFFVSYWFAGGVAAIFIAWLILPGFFSGAAEKVLKVKESSTSTSTPSKDS